MITGKDEVKVAAEGIEKRLEPILGPANRPTLVCAHKRDTNGNQHG
jgi:hypothetical protein